MNKITVANVGISQDTQGRFCLNDLHRAAGGEKKHGPSYWLNNAQTQELLNELSDTGITVSELNQPLRVYKGGIFQGTFVCKELVYAYAMWISPIFSLKVIRAYDNLVTQPAVQPTLPQTFSQALKLAYEQSVVIEQQQLQLTNDKPKVEFFDHVASASGLHDMAATAKMIGCGPKKIFNLCRAEGIFYLRGGVNYCKQALIDRGLFTEKMVTFDIGGTSQSVPKIFATTKGVQWLYKKFVEWEYVFPSITPAPVF